VIIIKPVSNNLRSPIRVANRRKRNAQNSSNKKTGKIHLHAATSRLGTSNSKTMKKMLHIVATLLCLQTISLSTVTCVRAEQPKQSCSHCPKHAPVRHSLPSCCTIQHQSPVAITSEVKRPVRSIPVLISILSDEIVQPRSFPVVRVLASPPSPPRIALRI
jgi:hypothetical protein